MGDAVSRSITLHTAQHTQVINAPIETVEKRTASTYIDRVCALQVVHDHRTEDLDYSSCTDFADIYKELGKTDIITMDTANPLYRYHARVGTKLYARLPDGSFPLCIPSNALVSTLPLREVLISECHDSPSMGHRGYLRTYAHMRKFFSWPSLRKDIRTYIASCDICLRAKPNMQGDRGRLRPNESPLHRMDSIAMDFMVGLPEVDGYSNLFVVVERLSKKVFLIPTLATANTLDIIRILDARIFSEHGIPLEIISDRDVKFTSEVWQSYFKALGTRLSMSYSYHQRFDGQTEVTNRTIAQIMRCYVNFNQDNWLELLPNIQSSINNSVHPTMEFSPNEIFYGRTVTRPVNLLSRVVGAPPTMASYVQELEDRSTLAQDYLRLAAVNFTRQHYSKLKNKTVDVRLQEGSYVMLDAKNLYLPGHRQRPSSKLTSRRLGPFKIVKKVSDVSYDLLMPSPWKGHCRFHVRNLTFVPPDQSSIRSPPEAEDIDDEEEYVVERLDAHRRFYHRDQYFVIYKGYTVDEGMWQDRDNLLETCPLLVKQANIKYGFAPLLPPTETPTTSPTSTPLVVGGRRREGRPRKIPQQGPRSTTKRRSHRLRA